MKCNQCGEELRIEREEYCKDVNGNPMYRDVAYCDTCNTRTPLRNSQNTNNFSPNYGSGQITPPKPPKKKMKAWQIVLIVFVAICFLGAFFQDEDSDKKNTKVTSEQNSNKDTGDGKQKKNVKTTKGTTSSKAATKPKATKKAKATLSPKVKKAQKKQKEKKAKKKFIASCKAYSYKKVMRNPKKYIGKKIKIKCQISQIQEDGLFTKKYYRCYSYSGYGIYAGNEYVIYDERISNSPKLLEDDIITVYGTIEEPEEVTRALTGTSDEVFTIDMKYVKLNKK